MSRKLGKKHFRYVNPTEGRDYSKRRSHFCIQRRVCDLYTFNLLNATCDLREVYWDSNQNNHEGIGKRVKLAKQKRYEKLNRYYNRAMGRDRA